MDEADSRLKVMALEQIALHASIPVLLYRCSCVCLETGVECRCAMRLYLN